MSKITEAIDKITEEVNKSNDHAIQYIGEVLVDTLTDATAEKILVSGKTLAGAYDQMFEAARKIQKGGKAGFSPDEGMKIAEKYFGITEKDKLPGARITSIATDPAPAPSQGMNINLMDLL